MTSKIRVGVRIRPVKSGSGPIPVSLSKEVNAITIADVNSGRCVSQLPYDYVFGPNETTTSVYTSLAKDIVINAVKGFNGTIFAYGQTASGKTHTMIGDSVNPGIVRQALIDIFDTIEKTPERMFLLRLSILDIYNEVLTDLLEPNSRKLHIRENADGTVFVENLSEEICTTPDDIIRFLNDGLARRHVGATNMNEYSSRSHSICRLIIESRPREEEGVVNVSQLNFVDLAGSERVAHTGASGDRLKEGQAINKSLFLLTLVITKLSEGQSFVNFRDSKLTRILQNALGGNSLTAIVCTVSPLLNFLDQTLSTLKFATSASNIACKPIVNESVSNEAMMKRMQQEIAELRAKIAQFESSDQREKAKQELAEKEQLFRGALCFSTRGFEEHKPPPRSRRLTWAPRDRCNFALTITDDDFSSIRNVTGSAIKRDLESILSRGGGDNSDVSRRSPVGNIATKRCRRREVIFRLPTEKPIEENADGEAEADSSSDGEVNGFLSPDDPPNNNGEPTTGILVDLDEPPPPIICRSAATSPIAFLTETQPQVAEKEDKTTQSEQNEGDDLFSIGREIFLENSVAHFEAREEIVKLECEIRRLSEENSSLKDQLESAKPLVEQPVTQPTTAATDCEKCRHSEDEIASVNSRYASLKTKYEQVVAALEEERGSKGERGTSKLEEATKRVAELELLLKAQNDRVVEVESQLALNSAMSADVESQLRTAQESLRILEEEKTGLSAKLAEAVSEIEACKTSLSEFDQKLRETETSENEAKRVAEEVGREKSEIECQLNSLRDEMSSTIGKLNEEKTVLQVSVNEKTNWATNLQSEKADVESKLASLQESQQALESRIKELCDIETKLRSQVASSAQEAADQLTHEREENVRLQIRIDELIQNGDVHQTVLSEFESKLKQTEEDNERLKSQISTFEREKSDNEAKCESLEAERVSMQDRINELLGTISSSSDEKGEEIVKIEQQRAELATQLEVVKSEKQQLESQIQDIRQEFDSLQSKANESDKEKSEIQAKFQSLEQEKSELEARLKQLDEEKQGIEANFQSVEQGKFTLEEEKRQLEGRLQTLEDNKQNVEQEKFALESQLKTFIEEKQEIATKLQSFEQDKTNLESLVQALENEKRSWEEGRQEVEDKLRNVEQAKSYLESNLAALIDEKREFETKFLASEQEKSILEPQLKAWEDERREFEAKLQSMDQERLAIESQLKAWEEGKQDIETKCQTLEQEKAALDGLVKVLEEEKREFESRMQAIQEEKAVLEASVSQLKESEVAVLNKVSSQLTEFEEKLNSVSGEKSSLEEKLAELENQLKAVCAEKDQLTAQAQNSTKVGELESEVARLQQEISEKAEEFELLRQEIDSMFEENRGLLSKIKQAEENLAKLQSEFAEKVTEISEKTHQVSRLEADANLLKQQISVADRERQMYLTELSEAGQEAARTKVELEKLKTFISTQTQEAACNTSTASLSTSVQEARTVCNTPNYGISPPRKSRLSTVLPSFSTQLSEKQETTANKEGLNSAEKTNLSMVSPAFTSPFSVSTISGKATPSKPLIPIIKFESGVQTEDEPIVAIIRRVQCTGEFKEQFVLKTDYDEAVKSYHQTVSLWDEMREKMVSENNRLRDRADRLTEAIGRVVDGGQLSPLSTPHSSIEKTTLTATGGDVTLSISTSDDNVDALLNRLRLFLKDKEDAVRSGFSRERDSWSETVKEFEEEIARLNKSVANFERQISAKDDELKQLGLKLHALETENTTSQHDLAELRNNFAAKTETLRQRDSELVDIKRSLEDRQTEIKRLQTELALTTASYVVADQGHKTSERGFAALQEQWHLEKAGRGSAEAMITDLQLKLSNARAEADSWSERARLHEDEENRLTNEVTRVQAMFEAAEEQLNLVVQQKAEMMKSLQDAEIASTQALNERESALSKLAELEQTCEQLKKELQQAQQEITKQQLLVESVTKSADVAEAKVEKARTLFNRMRDERTALEGRIKELRQDKQKAVELITKLKEERDALENLVREFGEKAQVLEARLVEVSQERDTCDQAVKSSRAEIRRIRDEQELLQRELAQRLRDLGKAWRQCLINAGMPVSEATETDPHQLIHEVKWTSKHSLARLNVLHALQGLGITCEWLYNESYEKISELEGSRRLMLAREVEAARTAEELKEESLKLRKALAGCRCRSNTQHAKLMKVDESVLTALNRKPIPALPGSSDEALPTAETKENKKSMRLEAPTKQIETVDNHDDVDMEMSP